MALRHRCPDGRSTLLERLERSRIGDPGDLESVILQCPRCLWSRNAQWIMDVSTRALARWADRTAR